VALITLAGIWLSGILDHQEAWVGARYRLFQVLQYLSPRGADAQRTTMVLIGDDEYWKADGPLQGRVPINREYLASLVDAAVKANAAVIALDFTLSSPDPYGNPIESPQFQGETSKLIDAIWNATRANKQVVLTRTINEAGIVDGKKTYDFESDIYGSNVPHWQNVRTGYHVLPDDVRNLPLVLSTPRGELIESFSLAIARADNARSLKSLSDLKAKRYAGFLPPEDFDQVTADELLNGSPRTSLLSSKVVIISGKWHQFSRNRGPVVGAWDTPVGNIPGALIHANYFEALFDKRMYRIWEGWRLKVIEFVLAAMVAIPFGVSIRSRKKKVLALIAPYMLILIVAYFSLINFGWFFDPVIPVVMLTLHGFVELVLHWKKEAGRTRLTP
jgi:CHASE2 domain-containing sensor protein